MNARDLLLTGYCSPMCLLALMPEKSCKCRCGGTFHGLAADADIGEPDLTDVTRIDDGEWIERLLLNMTTAEKRKWAVSRGWQRVGNSYVHPSRPVQMASLAYVVRKEMRADIQASRLDA